MSNPYVGEIRIFGGNFAPSGWSTCDGQTLSISEYETLFTLLGTTYGGNGQTTFQLPNLAARLPIHMGNNGVSTYSLGQNGGVTTVALTTNQIPVHTHPLVATTTTGNATSPANAIFAESSEDQFAPATTVANMGAVLQPQGGSQPHDNMHPYLAVSYIISLFGIYPTQS